MAVTKRRITAASSSSTMYGLVALALCPMPTTAASVLSDTPCQWQGYCLPNGVPRRAAIRWLAGARLATSPFPFPLSAPHPQITVYTTDDLSSGSWTFLGNALEIAVR
jgi:hypothetical protein